MTTATPAALYTGPASEERLAAVAAALTARGFAAEILDDVAAARARIQELIPAGASVLTAASETLRLSGIDADLNESGRYQAVRPQLLALDRVSDAEEIRCRRAIPEFVVGSVNAVTEAGSLVAASGSGSQLPAYSGGAGHRIWIIGAQKVVPDLPAALCRVEEHCLPLESERTRGIYGVPSAISRLLVLNVEPFPGSATVLLLREAIGF